MKTTYMDFSNCEIIEDNEGDMDKLIEAFLINAIIHFINNKSDVRVKRREE
ncbi:hypothetical protein ACTNEO_20415 [Gracilibacillus sp. HCP3S3_G5_1]|uniref:hypothetical protein n=1 Tax=unclassified Gracilibacillus TaxID=2625209 RepID=UPI003F891BB1